METTTNPTETQQAPVAAAAPEASAAPSVEAAPQAPQVAPEASAPTTDPAQQFADDGVALDDDGELKFGDKFFDAYREDQGDAQEEQKPEQETPAAATTPAPAFYTADELKAFESLDGIDPARFPEAMQPYIPVIRDYVMALQRQVGLLRSMEASRGMPQPPTQFQPQRQAQAPQPLGHKEIAEAARKLAAERLGVKQESIDAYDPEHLAALNMAVQEVTARNRAEVVAYQGQAQAQFQAQQQLQRFAVDLASRPDFNEFDAWVTQKLAAAGMSSDQLYAYAQQTGDLAGVQRAVAEMYQEWKRQGAQTPQTLQNPQPSPQQPVQPLQQRGAVPSKVPVLENAAGAAQVKKTVDLRGFGDMDEDAQARALIEMGVV